MNIGDTCKLKSGGPLMTIVTISQNTGGVKCAWFDGQTLHQEWFEPHAVKLAKKQLAKK